MNEIIICEKNKTAEAVAHSLGSAQKLTFNKIPYYYIKDTNTYVVPLRGHIKEYRNTDKYKSWSKSDPRDILIDPKSIFKYPMKYGYNYLKLLEFVSQKENINSCIIGTDADVEGCNIGLIDAFPVVKKAKNITDLSQLWLSSLQKSEIIKAYNSQIKPKWDWAYAGEVRAMIDALIGFSATREVSLTLRHVLRKINVQFVSIGRVQTCLLYLIYMRETQIKNFAPKAFWVINAEILNDNNKYKSEYLGNPIQTNENASKIHNKIRNEKQGLIKKQESNTKLIFPPTPLNTSRALQLITRYAGITAMHSLKILEDLYLNQLITYPRTDSDKYKPSFNHSDNITQFNSHSQYGNYSHFLLSKNQVTPNQGKTDADDHPPITPIKSVESNYSTLTTPQHAKVYDLIVRYYMSLFSKPGKSLQTRCMFSVKDEDFLLKNDVLVEKGPYEIAPFLMKRFDTPLVIAEGEKYLNINSIDLDERHTQPPNRYSDNTLIKLMEKFKIGTKSTRPSMIKILIDRQYIERQKRAIFLTDLGFYLIDNIKDVWQDFLEPSFTSYVETYLEQIKNGQKDWKIALEEIKREFLRLFDEFRKKKTSFIQKFEKIEGDFQKQQNQQITGALCPSCNNSPMKIIRTKKKTRFLACKSKECKNTLALPKTGRITILKNSKCQQCGFNVFKIKKIKNNRSYDYYMCPFCWSKGLNEKIEGYGFCSNCESNKITKDNCTTKN